MKKDIRSEKGFSIKRFNVSIVIVCIFILLLLGITVFQILKGLKAENSDLVQLHLLYNIKNLCVLLLFTIVIILSIIFCNIKFLIRPLINAVDTLRNNKRLEFGLTQEYNFLIRNYNAVHDENKKLMEVLKQEAINANEKYNKILEEERKSQVILGLASEYNSVYLVDFEEDTMIPYNINNTISERLNNEYLKNEKYSDKMELFITKFVIPEDKKLIAEQSDAQTIKIRLQESGYYRVNFRRYNMKGDIECIDMCISKIPNETNLNRIVLAFKNA